jgi:hypothetical protein
MKIPDDEMPIVFFLANRASVNPDVIVKMRLGGKSWMDITLHYGLTAEVFYVPVKSNPGPPYGKAYGHFKNRNKADWKSIRLSDTDILNFVNLRFMSNHYGYTPDEVIKLRASGGSFVDINAKIKKNKAQKKAAKKAVAQKSNDKTKGKSKGKKK